MSLLRNSLSVFACLVLLTQCTNRQEKTAGIGALLHLEPRYAVQAIKHPTSYIGEWLYSSLFYSSGFSIKENGTFTYHDQGCMGHSYSEGTWTRSGTDIFLTSYQQFATYKPVEIVEIAAEPDASVEPEPLPDKQKQLEGDSLVLLIDTTFIYTSMLKGLDKVTINISDTTHVYFDKVLLRLTGDTLYKLDKAGLVDSRYVQLDENDQ